MPALPLSTYQTLFYCSPVGDCLISPKFMILDCNAVFANSVARSREELIARPFFEIFCQSPNDTKGESEPVLRESLARVLSSGKPATIALQRYPIKVIKSDGSEVFEERFWSSVSTPVHDTQGSVMCISHNTMDVTDLITLKKKRLKEGPVTQDEMARLEAGMFSRAQTLQEVNKALEEERVRLRHLFDHAPGLIYFTRGEQHLIEQVNSAFGAMAGWRELQGKTMREAFPELAGSAFMRILDKVYQTGQRYECKGQRLELKNGPPGKQFTSTLYFDLVFQPIINSDGRIVGICGQGHDITEKKHVEDDLRTRETRWKRALEASGDGVWDVDVMVDSDNNPVDYVVHYSSKWKSMLGYGPDELNSSFDGWKGITHPEDLPRVTKDFEAHLYGETDIFSSEYRALCSNGEWMWILSRGAAVEWDKKGTPRRVIGTSIDISYRKRNEQNIWRQANFDALTGLPNRRLFRDRLEHEVIKSDRSGQGVGLLFIDLDRFKEVNDLLGHDAGDQLLVEAGKRISRCVRASDTVARLGGDEFTVILTELEHKPHIEETACKIIDALAVPFRLGSEVAYVTGSVGITLYPYDAENPEQLICNADQAMYWAKRQGRNQFRYFTRNMQEQAHARLRLSGDLRSALAKGQFQVYYQPIVEMDTGRIVKAEALLRWNHPKHGMVPPARFIPIAEESRMINEIGDWVFRDATEWSEKWSRRLSKPFEISVNRSPVQFVGQADGADWPKYLQSRNEPSCITVEITEYILADASPGVAETLLQYRDAGISVALDDFGTGYSSMAYLKRFDIDYLKIDQSFIQDIENNSGSRTITKSIVVMAHELGLQTIAEGIETPGQVKFLQEVGCDYGQGFLFSQPLPPENFDQLISAAEASNDQPSVRF